MVVFARDYNYLEAQTPHPNTATKDSEIRTDPGGNDRRADMPCSVSQRWKRPRAA